MRELNIIEPWYYITAYNILFLILSWFTVLYYVGSNRQKILYAEGGSAAQGAALFLSVILTLFIGLRPVSGRFFGDMGGYALTYGRLTEYWPISIHTEWLWTNLMVFCKKMGMNVVEFFLVVSAGYFMGMFMCAVMLVRKNLWIAVLFFFISFSAYSYATNGCRNGMACSLELIAIALLTQGGYKRYIAIFMMFCVMGIHRSTMLPSVAAVGSSFFLKDTKWPLRFWVASIFISLAVGPLVEAFFASLGFDDRMSAYSSGGQNEATMATFSQTGFRFDFLFYSVWPVVMVWYVTHYRKFKDQTFNILANTYLLSNAFWIMVIRSAFSNRFAYLSWFIYPLVIMYPLLRMNIWKDQDRKTAIIFFLYSGFSFFMFFIYYFGRSDGFRGFNVYWWK